MSTDHSRGPLDRLSYLLLAVFIVVTLGPALIGRGALVDLDGLTRFLPFSAIRGVDVNDTITCRSDTLNYYLPGISAIKSAFLSGDIPTWAPYEVGGAPLASLPNHGALSPLSLPYLLLPLWLAPAFVKLGEFAVAIGGMFAFLRRHGLSRGASVIAGIIFASSGFMIMWTNWPHTRVAAFIPALFWGLERMVQQRRPRDVVVVAVVVASMLLGGFPAVTLYALTVAAAYVLVRALTLFRSNGRAIAGLLARATSGVLLGVGLAAIQILPFVGNLGALGLEERQASGQHLPLGLLLTTVVPNSVGLCVAGEAHGPVNPIEAVGFLGAAAMVLVLCAVVLLPRGAAPDHSLRVFLGVALVAVTVLVWVGGPLLAALQSLPFFSTNSITRAQSVFGFLAAALAGVGIDRLLRGFSARRHGLDSSASAASPAARRRRGIAGAVILVAAVALAGWVLARARADAHRDAYAETWSATLLVPALFLVGAVAAVLLTRFGPPRARILGPVALALLAVGQSALFARTVLPLSDPANLYPVTPTHAFLKAHLGEDRWAATGTTLYPASADWYELRTPVGHEFTDPRWWDLLLATDPGVTVSRTYSTFSRGFDIEEVAGSHLLDQLSVRYWVASPGDVPGIADDQPIGQVRIPLRDGERTGCTVRSGPLRGVRMYVARTRQVPVAEPAVLHVAVHTPTGVREGSQLLGPELRRGMVRVATPGEDLPRGGGAYPVDVWLTGTHGHTVLRGSSDGLACSGVRPGQDGMRLAFVESGASVYERLGALPRVRWASHSRVEPDAETRVADLKAGMPDDLVLLDDDSTPAAAGEPAEVEVLSDQPERISAQVQASGNGYLVVADALVRDGWDATVDGRKVRLVHGNHAFAAVPVPGGNHRVELTYAAPGFTAGKLISAGSGLVVLGLLVWPWWTRRRKVLRPGRGAGDTLNRPLDGP